MAEDERPMTISQHLQELRRRLLYSVVAVGVAFVVCLFYQDGLMSILTRPHRIAIEKLHTKAERKNASLSAAGNTSDAENSPQDDFSRIVAKIEPSQPEVAKALKILRENQEENKKKELTKSTRLRVLKYQESFMNYLKVCLIAAAIIASPFVLLQGWKFISAGLYEKEKKAVTKYIPFSYVLFAAGVSFGYFFLVPVAMYYLAGYGSAEIVEVSITLEYYLSFFLVFTLALGAVFQTPLVMAFLANVGVFSPRDYAKVRKYVLIAAFLIGAALTPGPDVVSQVLLAIPLLGLYELGILLSRISAAKRAQAEKLNREEEV